MKDYKSPVSRLARLFKKSRDGWKKRAKQKQKKVRALEVKVRDLTKSREQWKAKAKAAQQELREIKKEQKSNQTEANQEDEATESKPAPLSAGTSEIALSAPAGHLYPVFIIQLGIQQIIHGLSSLRGCQKNFELLAQFFELQTPSFSSIRGWLFRLGLYQLRSKPEKRSDWIIIFDLTIELGQVKCLLILGIPAARLSKTGFALKHQDVEVLNMAMMSHSSGEIIAQKLTELSEQIGQPIQIVADYGSDLKKGIELYQQQNPELIYTYDVTHQMALLLKNELANDERYQNFLGQCSLTRQQTKQTELYFLAPPKRRLKARYLNVDTYVHWAQQVLSYQQQADFSQISPAFIWDKEARASVETSLEPQSLAQLEPLLGKLYPDQTTFTQAIINQLGPEIFAQNGQAICQAAAVGPRRFQKKLGWLADYASDIHTYAQMVELVQIVEKQLKNKGLNRASRATFEEKSKALSLSPRVQQFKQQIVAYLAQEGGKIPKDQTLLATSDVIESIFGKYKFFSAKRSLKEMGKMLLTIPLFTTKITSDCVKKAMESVRDIDVEQWAGQVFGQSMLSKRRAVLKVQKATQN
jgi:hypothetical protein